MCGIAGIISKDIKDINAEINKMTEIIKHRGPDGFGYYYGDNFAFGHRRLSIIDITPKGAQPMKYLDRYIITYNGEIYNYLELRKELTQYDYKFSTDSDTEVVMAAYDCWGSNCLKKFNGMWAFALFDKKKNNIFCARDRFAVKPFYYTEFNNKFIFASEIKQFTVLKDWKSIVNKCRLYDFLHRDGIHDHTNETLFKNVYQLRGGEYLEYDLSNYSFIKEMWYKISDNVNTTKIDFNDAVSEFKEIFTDSVKLRLRSDVKVGSCLSGGLDSSSIVCIMNDILKKDGKGYIQETVSSCSNIRKYDEQRYIDEVIHTINIKGHKIYTNYDELFPSIDNIIWHQDEPFGSTSVYAQWQVYEKARENNLIVMLDGQGADEYLAGYSSFHRIHFRELLENYKFVELKNSINNYKLLYNDYYTNPYKDLIESTFRKVFPSGLIDSILRSLKKVHHKSVNNQWQNLEVFNDGKYQGIIKNENNTIRAHSINQLIFTSLPKLLHHQDRNSMAHSVESRAPFIDYRLIEYVLKLPSHYKINRAITKYILRAALKGNIPNDIYNRYDKLGFVTPEKIWIREDATTFRNEILEACDRLKNYVDKDIIIKLFEEAIKRNTNFNNTIWKIVCVGRWIKVFNIEL